MSTSVDIPTLFRVNRDFRYLFGARLVSLFGDWFNTLAVLALLRSLGQADASDFGWIVILKTLPTLVASPIATSTSGRCSGTAKAFSLILDHLRFQVPPVPAAADRLLEDVIVHGTPTTAAERLARWTEEAGSVVLTLAPGLTDDEIDLTIDALATPPGVNQEGA